MDAGSKVNFHLVRLGQPDKIRSQLKRFSLDEQTKKLLDNSEN